MERRHEKMELDKYRELLDEHKWSFLLNRQDTSYSSFISTVRREGVLLQIATTNGPWFVDAYYDAQRRVVNKHVSEIVHQAREDVRSQYERLIPTGDKEFDEYRKAVVHHDWFFDYSDCINTWRAGNERQKKLEAIAKEKGGLYEVYFSYYKNQVYNTKPKEGEVK